MDTNLPAPEKLKAIYERMIANGEIESDQAQLDLIAELDKIINQLGNKRLSRKSSALGWLFGKSKTVNQPLKGLYIWGDVGRGKSMIMDLFFELVPNERKRRAHFNDFMTDAQERIHSHRKAYERGENQHEDPIPSVAAALSEEATVLCFDEFTVTDIADAMILGRLFEVMFENGVTVIATSNVAPKNLYKNGLNRGIFLRFIDILIEHVEVVELSSRTDYRMEKLDQVDVYHSPLDDTAALAIDNAWKLMTGLENGEPETLDIKGRELTVPQAASGVARVSFQQLCLEPRSALDYLALARRFHTLIIENIPVMEREHHNAAKRFILLIDTLYDNNTRIVMSAQAMPENLYTATSGTEAFEFKRTISRLHEMQSRDYIGGGAG